MKQIDRPNQSHIHILQTQLQDTLKKEGARLKQAGASLWLFYQEIMRQPTSYANQLFSFKLNGLYQGADLYLRLIVSNDQLQGLSLNLQIDYPLPEKTTLHHGQLIKSLSLLAKINHEYIKLLSPRQIESADLMKLGYKSTPAGWLIEQQISLDLAKTTLEKWCWLLDYFLSSLQS
jgi:hypothetical protein